MILHATFFSKCLRKNIDFSAALPMDIPRDPNLRDTVSTGSYKTLYLLHGYTGNCNEWLLNSNIQEISAVYNLAIIMPSGDNGFYLDNTTGARYGEYTGKEIIEFTRALFPLSRNRQDTLIGGFSMGGFGAMRNGLKYSDTFGSILSFSSALITDAVAQAHGDMRDAPENKEYYTSVFGDPEKLKGGDNDPRALLKRLKETGKPIPGIYMACGTEDFLIQENRNLRDYFKKMQVDFAYEEAPGMHNWDFVNSHIKKALNWYQSRNAADSR